MNWQHCVTCGYASGGRTSGYSGKTPGIIEEAITTLERGRPVYASSIFGGASGFVARALSGGKVETAAPVADGKLNDEAAKIGSYAGKIRTGLQREEELRLWRSRSIEEIVELVLRGAIKVWAAK